MAKEKITKGETLLETNVQSAPVKDVKWESNQIETDEHPLVDSGTGNKIILRCFEYRANPEAFKLHRPSKQELFSAHARSIEMFLWKDGLLPLPHIKPKIIISKNRQKYRIFVGAQAKNNEVIADRPKTLQEITNPK